MATKPITEGTGKRMAVALEGIAGIDNTSEVKIPHVDSFDLVTIAQFAEKHGHYSQVEITAHPYASTSTAGSPLLCFLKGLSTLSDFETADDGRVAFCSYGFMRLLLFEASRFNQNGIVKTIDGIVTKIDNCTLKEISNELFPLGFSFLILGNRIINGLNELEANDLLDNAEALNALLAANADALYYHAGGVELNVLPVTVAPGAAGKMIVKIGRDKTVSTDKWFYKTADAFENLPTATYGTSVDVTTSSAPWFQSTELTAANAIAENTWEITPTAGHTAIAFVEVMRSMKPKAYRSKAVLVGE